MKKEKVINQIKAIMYTDTNSTVTNDGRLYYSISEVASMLGVNASLLRFWEKEFPDIKPVKNKKGTRSYTKGDIELLKKIYHLTKECGFTLEGAREQLRLGKVDEKKVEVIDTLKDVRTLLKKLKDEL